MRVKSIMLDNFAKFDHVKVDLDPNLTFLIGPNGAGKSTIGISALWFIMKGIAQKGDGLQGERFRFIGEEKASGTGTLVLHDEKLGADIAVKRTLTKSGHKVEFIAPPDMMLDQDWLNELFNVYLIAPQAFIDLSSKEQAIALGIDTKEYDNLLKAAKEDYTVINRQIRALGEIVEVPEVKRVSSGELASKLSVLETRKIGRAHV